MEVGEVVLFSEVTNVHGSGRDCPLLRGNKCTITTWKWELCLEVVLFSEVTNVLSLHGSGRGCPLLRGNKCTITTWKWERLSSSQR